jgi:[ribosomal protein S18]-alanine N-acetyltransferase
MTAPSAAQPSVALRPATMADLDAIMGIETSVFRNDAWSRRTMRAELDGPHAYYLVAEDAAATGVGGIVGYAGLFAPEGAREADIQTIAVAPTARRRGIGRALMAHLIGESRGRGARQLFLEVRADNPSAQTLYGSLGFEQIAVREKYYQPDGVDAFVMRLDLAKEVAP